MKIFYLIVSVLLISITATVHSANFCVTTTTELQQALDVAGNNSETNTIKVAQGSYAAPTGGFKYLTLTSPALKISGGWSLSAGDPCAVQTSRSPFDTVLDGQSIDRVLLIASSISNNMQISNLAFINGFVTGVNQDGGGVKISTITNSVEIVFENNAFINNHAAIGSALWSEGSSKLVIRNSLFAANHSEQSSTVNLSQINGWGVYFTNNTVIENTTDGNTTFPVSGLRIYTIEPSNIFVANNVLWNNQSSDLWLGGTGIKYLRNNDIGTNSGFPADEDSDNISLAPIFVPDSITYVPALGSPLTNNGLLAPQPIPIPTEFENDWALGDKDILGNPRVQDTGVDIGAFESSPPPDLIFVDGFE